MNPFYDIIEDTMIEALESEETFWLLPDDFTICIPDEAFRAMIKAGLVFANGPGPGNPVPDTVKNVTLQIQEHRVTVRSDADPQNWLPEVMEKSTLH